MGQVFAVIMAGGRGERLWPLSTPLRPKQFLPLLSGRSFLQATAEHVAPLVGKDGLFVVVPQRIQGACGQRAFPSLGTHYCGTGRP